LCFHGKEEIEILKARLVGLWLREPFGEAERVLRMEASDVATAELSSEERRDYFKLSGEFANNLVRVGCVPTKFVAFMADMALNGRDPEPLRRHRISEKDTLDVVSIIKENSCLY